MRLLLPLLLAVLGLLTWLVLRGGDDTGPGRQRPPGTPEPSAATGRPLPPLEGAPETAPPADEVQPIANEIAAIGPLGRDAAVLPDLMKAVWRPAEGPPHTYVGLNNTTLTFRVQDGKVVGATAGFAPDALSASLKAVSPWLVGNQDALPIHWEAFTAEAAQGERQGSFTTSKGVTVYFRGTLRTEGDPPYGPETLELSLEPFARSP